MGDVIILHEVECPLFEHVLASYFLSVLNSNSRRFLSLSVPVPGSLGRPKWRKFSALLVNPVNLIFLARCTVIIYKATIAYFTLPL
jgi:hypothetical protein